MIVVLAILTANETFGEIMKKNFKNSYTISNGEVFLNIIETFSVLVIDDDGTIEVDLLRRVITGTEEVVIRVIAITQPENHKSIEVYTRFSHVKFIFEKDIEKIKALIEGRPIEEETDQSVYNELWDQGEIINFDELYEEKEDLDDFEDFDDFEEKEEEQVKLESGQPQALAEPKEKRESVIVSFFKYIFKFAQLIANIIIAFLENVQWLVISVIITVAAYYIFKMNDINSFTTLIEKGLELLNEIKQ